jgi:hypothetical protein
MTQDEIIEMARQLGICELTSKPKQDIHYSLTIHEMQQFAKLIAQHEREACANVCEGLERKLRNTSYTPNGFSCAKAIRARGQ